MIKSYGVIWHYGAMEQDVNFQGGGYMGHMLSTLTYEHQKNIYLLQMTWYHTVHVVLLTATKCFLFMHACAADQFYITTLTWTCEIFPVKQIAHVAIANTYTSMKTRDIKKEKQRKSSFVIIIFP